MFVDSCSMVASQIANTLDESRDSARQFYRVNLKLSNKARLETKTASAHGDGTDRKWR